MTREGTFLQHILCIVCIFWSEGVLSLHLPILEYFPGSVSSLEYFTLSSPTYLRRRDDGHSDAINVLGGFPFGSQYFSSIFVS